MQSAQKAGEPSMEDILASIRKIIAEDPNAPAAAKPPVAPSAPLAMKVPQQAATVVAQPSPPSGAKPRGTLSDLDRELSDLLSEPVDVPPAARPAFAEQPAAAPPNTSGLGTWFRGKPRSAPDPHAGPANEPSLLPSLDARPDAVAPPDARFELAIEPPPQSPPVAAPSPARPLASLPPADVAASAPAATMATMQSILGRLAQASAPSQAPAQALAQAPGQAPGQALATPVPSSVSSRVFPVSGPDLNPPELAQAGAQAATGEPGEAIFEVVAVPAQASGAQSLSPDQAAAVTVEVEAVPVAAPTAAGVSAAQPGPRDPGFVMAPSPRPAMPVAANAALAGATAAAGASPPEAAIVETLAAPPVATPSDVAVPAAPALASGAVAIVSIEDTLADMMRPMVRQWLDENLQRALEKAVRSEVAESLKKMPPVFDPKA